MGKTPRESATIQRDLHRHPSPPPTCTYLEIHRAVGSQSTAHRVPCHVELDVWRVILAEKPIDYRLADGRVDFSPDSLRAEVGSVCRGPWETPRSCSAFDAGKR